MEIDSESCPNPTTQTSSTSTTIPREVGEVEGTQFGDFEQESATQDVQAGAARAVF